MTIAVVEKAKAVGHKLQEKEEHMDEALERMQHKAAQKIQASFRGKKSRKQVKKMKEKKELDAKAEDYFNHVVDEHADEVPHLHAEGCPNQTNAEDASNPGLQRRATRITDGPFELRWAGKTFMEDCLNGVAYSDEAKSDIAIALHQSKSGKHLVTGGEHSESDELPQEPRRRHTPFIEHKWFNILIALAVMANAIQMGVETDHPEWEDSYAICENVFNSIFVFEMMSKICFLRHRYFCVAWNCLDFLLVSLSLLDFIIELLSGGEGGMKQLSSLRMLRILRIARMVRLLKVFRSLWLIIKGILDAVPTISWAGILQLLMLYVFAILFVQVIGKEKGYYRAIEDPEWAGKEIDYIGEDFDVYQHFGNVLRSMYTCFEICLEPTMIRPVIEKQPYMLPVMIAFIFVSTFGVMNVIVGVIVDTTMAASTSVKGDEEGEKILRKVQAIEKIRKLCMEMDTDGDGYVSLPEVTEALKRPDLIQALQDVTLPVMCGDEEFYRLMDSGGQDMVTHMKVVKHLLRAVQGNLPGYIVDLKGGYHRFHFTIREAMKQCEKRHELLDARLTHTQSMVDEGTQRLANTKKVAAQIAELAASQKGKSFKDDPLLVQANPAKAKDTASSRKSVAPTKPSIAIGDDSDALQDSDPANGHISAGEKKPGSVPPLAMDKVK
eukprot:gnl/MRDRNA2_/MRDRNA2_107268_c0_seq1.p1 gnl/MRDRNA2_/MRDRNA2_107268_c0~~gnl/MRDRNA2_/MRDRNA2_107268_c0_seq1.p1  ORF type:complete len:665 (-),score=142.03 gnl/MRDRNA2_/MRDRNA2_107268_c0_seq1:62-2056(-)